MACNPVMHQGNIMTHSLRFQQPACVVAHSPFFNSLNATFDALARLRPCRAIAGGIPQSQQAKVGKTISSAHGRKANAICKCAAVGSQCCASRVPPDGAGATVACAAAAIAVMSCARLQRQAQPMHLCLHRWRYKNQWGQCALHPPIALYSMT